MNYRAIFLSDIHLGFRASHAEQVVAFLRDNDAYTIYLVGDIIDGWALSRSWYWPQSHNDVAQKILRKARKGTRVVYIAGNHDEFLRSFLGITFGDGIELMDEVVHVGAHGDKYLVLHGDKFDEVIQHAKWLAYLGDKGYDILLYVNRWNTMLRKWLGLGHWSVSKAIKYRVKQAVNFIGNYEEALSHECARRGFAGVICGHIHHPEIRQIHNALYMNCGDWVESCTALVEHHDGHFEIVSGA
jgi:UDP-2,3-diacylglucosamine pyrophosphatase LpxH